MTKSKTSLYLSLPKLDVNQRYTLPEATLFLRQSMSQTYKQIAEGSLNVLKCGARSYVHGSEIARVSGLGDAG